MSGSSRYLLEGLVELALLEQLQDVSLLRLVVEVCSGDGRPGSGAHGLHDAGGDDGLLLPHRQAHLAFYDALQLAQDGLLQTGGDTELLPECGAVSAVASSSAQSINY